MKKSIWILLLVIQSIAVLGVDVVIFDNELHKQAEQGDVSAQYHLGGYYKYKGLEGDGCQTSHISLEKSISWYQLAAEQGHAKAQHALGRCYEEGTGVTKNYKEAVRWYRLAANQGDVAAQGALGRCYARGRGVSRDYEEAVRWYRLGALAAEQNRTFFWHNTPVTYWFELAETNEWVAIELCKFAAEKGLIQAQNILGIKYDKGAWLAESKQLLKRAGQGHPNAQYEVGQCYSWLGAQGDLAQAAEWYRLSAEQGYADAQREMGECYHDGIGVPEDCKEAVKWYRLATEQGDCSAESSWNSLAITDDYAALERDTFKANENDSFYQFLLGLRYDNGDGVREDDREAAKWYRLAAEQGRSDAQCNLGISYYFGYGVLEDYVEAYAWCVIAAMNGSDGGAKSKSIIKQELNSLQIAAGQERAKELQAMIERKKQISDFGDDEMPSADISPSSFGSGLLIDGGYVLTCWHVVEGGDKISISCQGKDYATLVVQKDPANDIAILRVTDAPAGVPLRFSDVKLGENVFTLGFPHPDLQGFDVKFTTGSINALTGPGSTPVYYQISAPLQSGNSGGPLFDEQGNLVGMVAAKLDSLMTLAATGDLPQNVNYAIKADYLKPILKTVNGITIKPAQTKPVNLLSLVEELKKSVVMIKVY